MRFKDAPHNADALEFNDKVAWVCFDLTTRGDTDLQVADLQVAEQRPHSLRVAIDTGGTFTDCVYIREGEIEVLKISSTPADASLAVLEAVRRVGAGASVDLRHGTTVGTNTMLERKGARVAFVTTEGFEDTIAIGRQTRSSLYDWFAPIPVCLVPRELRFGVPERVSAEGEILRSPTDDELSALVEKVRSSAAEAIAISLLFCFANPETERRVEQALRCLGLAISVSHRILPEFREYERAATTVVNAYLAPRIEHYLLNLQERVADYKPGSRVAVMQSSGGTIPVRLAAQEPVRTVLSGPAGGVIGATAMARIAGFGRIIGCDMGGTSTDVFLADAAVGGVQRTRESIVAGVPVSVPMLDIHTVGAGGGSIARFDKGGMLRVGPESAGAEPGPICFGRGLVPTVTDANLLLGRLDLGSFLGGGMELDRERTERIMAEHKGSLQTVEEFAAGILRVIEAQMEKAIRVISIERGYDPREFTLVPFGGGGPLHACALARALRIPTVLVPKMPGALSAVGILLADSVRDYSQTVMLPGSAIGNLTDFFADLEQRGTEDFSAEGLQGDAQCSVDLRYRGQGYELNIPYDRKQPQLASQAFHELHQQRYGFSDAQKPLEIVNLRLRMVAAGESYSPPHSEPVPGDAKAAWVATRDIYFGHRFIPSNIYRRDRLLPGDVIEGPAMITEYTSATILPPACRAQVDGFGNLLIHVEQETLDKEIA
jgi:N-methylhydantoinase A